MGGGETERFGDKQRMTKTEREREREKERERESKQEKAGVYVRVRTREGSSCVHPPPVDELVSNQIRYKLPPPLSVKTQSL